MNRDSWKKSEPTKQQLDIIKERIINKKRKRKQNIYRLCFGIVCLCLVFPMIDKLSSQQTDKESEFKEGIVESTGFEDDEIAKEGDYPYKASSTQKDKVYFNAEVLEIYTDSLFVECLDMAHQVFESQEKVWVSTDVISTHRVPQLNVGDKIRVVFNGIVQETDPLQLPTVFEIYLLDDNGEVINE